jgi:23S rRNA (uridine2552-2'-O)-methyltransferase
MTTAGRVPAGARRLKERLKSGKRRSVSSKAWLERQLNDPYVAEARRLGFRSRSAFKLVELDDKYRLLKPGQRVVDLGAAPGGWSQVAAERTKAAEGRGKVIALDMHSMDPIAGVTILKHDFLADDAPALLLTALGGEKADLVISDMAAHATGHRQTDHIKVMGLADAALDFARLVLKPGGTFLAKVLRGGTEREILLRMKQDFADVRHVKPRASRQDSAELFVLAQNFRG